MNSNPIGKHFEMPKNDKSPSINGVFKKEKCRQIHRKINGLKKKISKLNRDIQNIEDKKAAVGGTKEDEEGLGEDKFRDVIFREELAVLKAAGRREQRK
jgi:hypothetical protein